VRLSFRNRIPDQVRHDILRCFCLEKNIGELDGTTLRLGVRAAGAKAGRMFERSELWWAGARGRPCAVAAARDGRKDSGDEEGLLG